MSNPDIVFHLATASPDSPLPAHLESRPGTAPQTTKTAQVLASSVTDPAIQELLQVFIPPHNPTGADNRRNTRAQVLQDAATSNSQIIGDFGLVALQVRDIGQALESMHVAFADMTSRVNTAVADVGPIVQESEAMAREKRKLDYKSILLQAFMQRFTIPSSDSSHLTSSPEALNDDFFVTLQNIKRIYTDCQVLLGSENTRAGVDIMDIMTKNLNSAYQKLYLWLQRELKSLSFENPVGNSRVRKALQVLTGRPTLFQSCIDTLAESRQQHLAESFNLALAGGVDSDRIHPIDIVAHDPVRYVGDMLAWLHSSLVGELEALGAIFEAQPEEDVTRVSSGDDLETPLDENTRLPDHTRPLVDKSLEPTLSTFRLRTEHVLSSHEDPTLLYGLLNILIFYRDTFSKLLWSDAFVVITTSTLVSTATRQLQSCLRDLVRAVQQDLPKATSDLSPPAFLLDALGRFKDLIGGFEASLIPEKEKPSAFDMIYSEALQPYIQGCQTLSKDLPPPLSHIFMVNCLEVSKNSLRVSNYGNTHFVPLVDDIVDDHVGSIIIHLHNHLVEASGLSKLLPEFDESLRGSASTFTMDHIIECSQRLDEFLPLAMADSENQLIHISRPSLRKGIVRNALDRFIEDFMKIEERLEHLPEDQFSREWFPRTTEELRILLG